jgi:hypothetical protein
MLIEYECYQRRDSDGVACDHLAIHDESPMKAAITYASIKGVEEDGMDVYLVKNEVELCVHVYSEVTVEYKAQLKTPTSVIRCEKDLANALGCMPQDIYNTVHKDTDWGVEVAIFDDHITVMCGQAGPDYLFYPFTKRAFDALVERIEDEHDQFQRTVSKSPS